MLSLNRYCFKTIEKVYVKSYVPLCRSCYTNAYTKAPSLLNSYALLKRNHIFVRKGLFQPNKLIVANCSSNAPKRLEKLLGSWLLTCSGMVFVAVVLGGVTRLTESGLSMVTWKLLGEKMPKNDIQWLEEFDRYKQFPEYKITNKNMTLEEFKNIWWMEYLHRMWGRLIGGVFLIPAAYFWIRGRFNQQMKLRVGVLGTLIGIQGLMGWYMVQSGLEDRFSEPSDVPRVSQYRLAAHLGLAFIIYTGFLYNALDHLLPAEKLSFESFSTGQLNNTIKKLTRLRKVVHSTKGLIFFTALSGAFVAGMDAGLIYNTFPKMADKWVPDDIFFISPIIKNFTENPTTVQFDHRVLGTTTLALITCIGFMSYKHKLPGHGSKAVAAVLCAGYLQVILGISTLLNHVPLALAASHQSGSLILLSTIIWLCHELKYLKLLPK
ncbi:heme A synthase COX15 isoform X2 [Prorops nasuta]